MILIGTLFIIHSHPPLHLHNCHNDELQNGHFPQDNAERDEDGGSRELAQQEAVESQADHRGVGTGTTSPQLDKPRG